MSYSTFDRQQQISYLKKGGKTSGEKLAGRQDLKLQDAVMLFPLFGDNWYMGQVRTLAK